MHTCASILAFSWSHAAKIAGQAISASAVVLLLSVEPFSAYPALLMVRRAGGEISRTSLSMSWDGRSILLLRTQLRNQQKENDGGTSQCNRNQADRMPQISESAEYLRTVMGPEKGQNRVAGGAAQR